MASNINDNIDTSLPAEGSGVNAGKVLKTTITTTLNNLKTGLTVAKSEITGLQADVLQAQSDIAGIPSLELINDPTFATATSSNVPSAASVQAYVDAHAGEEFVQDTVGAMIVSGTNVTATYNDAAGTLTIDATGTGGAGAIYAADMTALRSIAKAGLTNGDQAVLEYHTNIKYGGGGIFVWKAASTETDDNGTIIASNDGGNGRWLRQIPFVGRALVNWFGAKASNSTSDATINKTAIQSAITFCELYSAGIGSGFQPKVEFAAGTYYTDPIKHSFAACQFVGEGSGVSRLVGSNGFVQPLIFITGGTYTSAMPYGGIRSLSVAGGDNTYPAIVYVDGAIDNQVAFDDLAEYMPTTAVSICDGLSIHNYLNMSTDKMRHDRIGGYGFRIRRDSEMASLANASDSSSYKRYRFTAYDSSTGVITFINTASEPIAGSACLMFTTGVLPTRASTGLALKDAKSGTCFFMGNITETGCTLHDTEADARAGTSPILLTAATGSGTHQLCVFQASFTVTATNAGTDTITYINDKNIIIPTAVSDTRTTTYGNGNTGTGTIVTTNGVHAVIPVTTGTLDTALTAGRAYWPIYVDAVNVKLADTAALAVAGTAINLNGDGTGTTTLLYDHQLSILGVSGLINSDYTYDNAAAYTSQTTNTIARGGLGVLYADFRWTQNKGPITFNGHRIEINKQPAEDQVYAPNVTSTMFRIEIGRGDVGTGTPACMLTLNGMVHDVSTSCRSETIKVAGNSGNADLAPTFTDNSGFGFSTLYINDRGTAVSKGLPLKDALAWKVGSVRGYRPSSIITGRNDGLGHNSINGAQNNAFAVSQVANSVFKTGDLMPSLDGGVAYYKAVQTTKGYSKGTGATNATGTTVSATAGDKQFVLTARATEQNFGNGAVITIPGAGVASANITGTVLNLNQLGTGTWSFQLFDETTGNLIPCSTTVSAVTATYPAAVIARVPVLHTNSAALNFASIAALASEDLTIAAPTGVTLTAGKPIRLGLPSNVPSGVIYTAFVTTGGASVTVRATNITAGAIDPASGTFSYEVSV